MSLPLRLVQIAVLALLAAPAPAREISGAVAYHERIALPPGTELLVVLNGPAGPLAEQRTTPEAQVPLPFALQTGETGPLTLRAALFAGGVPIWMTAESPVPAGEGAVDLGVITLHRHVALGFATTMLCGDRQVEVDLADGQARLRVGGQVIALTAKAAASGARYADAAGNAFWSKGNRASVTLAGEVLAECLPVIAPTLPIIARGNEPFWTLTLSHEGMVWAGMDGARRAFQLPAAIRTDAGTLFDSGAGLAVTIAEAVCRDTMTGMPHPLTVTAVLDGQALAGCGGDPRALLAGTWRLVELPGLTLPEGAEVTLEVLGERVAGKAGCNRYMGGLDVTGESLTLSPVGATMMACDAALMTLEQGYLALLPRVGRFDIDAAGQLVLLVDGQPGAVFAR